MDTLNNSMEPLDLEEEPSLLSLSLSALDLSDKVITDSSDLTVDNVNMLNATKQTLQESIQTEYEQLVEANHNKILVSVMRTYFADKKEAPDADFLDILGQADTSDVGDILCDIVPDWVEHNFAIIKRSSSEIANLAEKLTEAWKLDLFPSLIGSYDKKYSEEALDTAVERLHKVIVKRAIQESELADKRVKLATEEKEVNQMLTRLLSTKLTKQGKIMVVEVKAKLEMLKAKQRVYETEAKKAASNVGVDESVESPNDELVRLTLENHSLSQERDHLLSVKSIIAQLDQEKVQRFKELHKNLQWAKKMDKKA